MNSVQLSSDAYLVCSTHALSTEKEEVMGLLLGEIQEKVVHICSAYAMRRSDKQPDRVEISPEQLSAAAIEAEHLATKLNRPIQVLGWYHSHPHITVWPSHVDVRTQADYQQMDPNFVGLIFSCFSETDKRCNLQVICFQSVTGTQGLEHVELALSVHPTVAGTIGPMTLSALTRLPLTIMEEEKEACAVTQQNCTDLLMLVHNSGVYTQRLTEMMQVIAGPIIQVLEEEVEGNRRKLIELNQEKKKLSSQLLV